MDGKEIEKKRAELEMMGIHELRGVGRMWGIPSPTVLRKEDLINEIVLVMTGEKPFISRPKIGRPAKSTFLSSFQEDLMPKDFENFVDMRTVEDAIEERTISFSKSEDQDFATILEEKTGYLVKFNQYYYFCTEDEEIVQVPNLPIVQYGLVKGDLLVVLASPYKKNKLFIAREIVSINGEKAEESKRVMCRMKDVIIKSNPDVIDDIKEGTKIHFTLQYGENYIDTNFSTLKKFQDSGYEILIVAVGLPADGPLKIQKKLNAKLFISLFENEPLNSFESIMNAINHATVLTTLGKKVLILILDVENVTTELNLYFVAKGEKAENGFTYSTLKYLRRLTGLNRCLENGGSATIITTSTEKNLRF